MKTKPASNSRRRYAKTQALADVIVEIVDTFEQSMSTRQVYYQCVSRGAVENCDAAYNKVQRLVVELRRDGLIGYDRIVDRRRIKHQRAGWDGAEQIIDASARQFRRDIWTAMDTVVMVGLEKVALEGVFAEAVDEYGASLWTLQGYGSESFLFEWAEEIKEQTDDGKNVVVYYFGDHDPSGLDIERDAIAKLEAHGAVFKWGRAGLLWSDFDTFDLVNVPVKTGDTKARKYVATYGNRAAELDALRPDVLQKRITDCLVQHIDRDAYQRVLRDEQLQRDTLQLVAKNWNAAVAGARGDS